MHQWPFGFPGWCCSSVFALANSCLTQAFSHSVRPFCFVLLAKIWRRHRWSLLITEFPDTYAGIQTGIKCTETTLKWRQPTTKVRNVFTALWKQYVQLTDRFVGCLTGRLGQLENYKNTVRMSAESKYLFLNKTNVIIVRQTISAIYQCTLYLWRDFKWTPWNKVEAITGLPSFSLPLNQVAPVSTSPKEHYFVCHSA